MLPLTAAGQQAAGMFQDSLPSRTRGRTIGVRVRQRALAWSSPADRDYAIVEYTLRNLSGDTLRPLHAGLFMDWDIPAEPYRNLAAWDSVRALGYVHDALQPSLYAGVKLLRPVVRQASYYAINNSAPASDPVSPRDGFSTAEKFLTLSSGTRRRTAGGTTGSDVSHVVGAVLGRLAPNDSVTVAFAVLAAPSLAQLQASADAAQLRYTQVLPARAAAQAAGWSVYPNPTQGRFRVELPVALAAGSRLTLLNTLGQQVQAWPVAQPSTALDVRQVPPGVYLLQWQTPQGELLTRRLVVQQ
jgi:hypothetical protein